MTNVRVIGPDLCVEAWQIYLTHYKCIVAQGQWNLSSPCITVVKHRRCVSLHYRIGEVYFYKIKEFLS